MLGNGHVRFGGRRREDRQPKCCTAFRRRPNTAGWTRRATPALFEVISSRYLKSSVALTSHVGIASWSERLGDPMMAAAMLDRLLHRGIVCPIEGPSYRMRSHQARAENLRRAVGP